jgi:hypothetical protein
MRLRTKGELGLPKWVPAVEGTFDDPPIVMWESRLKMSLICLGAALPAGFAYVWLSGTRFWWILFGLVAVLSGLKAIFRGALILSPGGLVFRTGFRTIKYQWSDFDSFVVLRGRTSRLAGKLSASSKSRRWWLTSWRALGFCWELPLQRIADVLNEARRRWGPKGTAS